MAINAVNTSTGAASQTARAQQQPEAAQPVAKAKRNAAAETPQQSPQPKPVVNLQGQMTGKVINTKA